MFGFPPNEDIDVVEALLERIALLKKVNESEDWYQSVIPVCDGSNNNLSSHNIYTLRHKSLFLIRAYQIVLERLILGVPWVANYCASAVS